MLVRIASSEMRPFLPITSGDRHFAKRAPASPCITVSPSVPGSVYTLRWGWEHHTALEEGMRIARTQDRCAGHLDARDDAALGEQLREQNAVVRLLVEGLRVEDSSREVIRTNRVREQHLAVKPAVLLRVGDANLLETVSDRAGTLIAR
eukprot:1394008-Rhodomonas_salina.1